MQNDEFYLKKCIKIAKKGLRDVSPNPMVGCVIVNNNKIISEGYHKKNGYHHAEVNAINSLKDKNLLSKSTLYVNLEPCSHLGKTPPCCDLIIEYKIPKVVIGCVDTYSKVSGAGIKKMQNSGIDVKVGILEKESRKLNKRFFTFHEKKRPYIILKWAESKDGFIAPLNQSGSFWMTSAESKKLAHQWRSEEDAILIGRITGEKDNPSLTVRELEGKNPIRIVIDRNLRLSRDLNLFNNESKTIIFNDVKSEIKGTNTFVKVDFNNLIKNTLNKLYQKNIQSVIIEGGSVVLQSFIDEDMWDEARVFITNKILINGVKAPNIKKQFLLEKKIGRDQLRYYKLDS